MRVDTRPHIQIDGPFPLRRRRRVLLALAGYLLIVAALIGAVLVSMAAPLPY